MSVNANVAKLEYWNRGSDAGRIAGHQTWDHIGIGTSIVACVGPFVPTVLLKGGPRRKGPSTTACNRL